MMQRGRSCAGLAVLAALVCAGSADALPRISILSWRACASVNSWTIATGSSVTQAAFVGTTDIAIGPTLKGSLELASQDSEWDGRHLGFDRSLTGAFLLRYQPPAAQTLIEFGAATPATSGSLTRGERELVRLLGEPLLGFADSEPARGWRGVVGAARGWAVRRGLSIVASAGVEIAAPFDVAPAVRLDPSDRIVILAGGEHTRAAGRSHARLSLAFESEESVSGAVLRKPRSVVGIAGGTVDEFGPLRVDARIAFVQASGADAYDPLSERALVRAGPGRGFDLSAIFSSPRLQFGRVRSAVLLAYQRYEPRGLFDADGWAARLVPRIIWTSGARSLAVGLGYRTGDCRLAGAARESINGWVFDLEYGRDAAPPEAE